MRTGPSDPPGFVPPAETVDLPTADVADLAGIADRRTIAEEFRASEERFLILFEHAPVGIFPSVPEGRFLAVNPALVRMLGYSSPEELVGAASDIATQIYVDPGERPRIMADLLAHDGWVHSDEVRWRRRDGHVLTVDMTGRKVVDPAGRIVHPEGFIEDVTERKRAEEELRQGNARYDDLTRRAPVGIHTLRISRDGTSRVEYVSEKLCRMLGVDRRDVLRDVGAAYAALLPDTR